MVTGRRGDKVATPPASHSLPHPVTPSPFHPLTDTSPLAALSTEGKTDNPAYFRSIAELGVQVAEALDYAHEEGIVHRDVKPSNLILDERGKVWVTDFGLARVEADPGMTMTGDILGTLRYMSPEQALAKRVVVDHRTDVYSLGVTLYELLTLRPAFAGDDRQELLRQIAFEEPAAPRRLNRSIPGDLETILLKAMAKNPAERYATAGDLADDLRRFLEDRPIVARRPSLVQRTAKWSRRHRHVVWSAAVSAVVLLLMMVVGSTIGNVMIAQERTKAIREGEVA
ncbi:MAG: serine/threonine-protein kinase [Planctomycetota bacterium]